MRPVSFDPGLTQTYSGKIRRTINKDGTFNVRRTGARLLDRNAYLALIHLSWPKFLALVFLAYFAVNILFAVLYIELGTENLRGAENAKGWEAYLNAFFFSAQTITTVGYGSLSPNNAWVSAVAGIEAMFGLMGFALATGILYGRFSRPSARIKFSRNMVVAPYQDVTALQFRVANQRSNNLMELEAKILLMVVDPNASELRRQFFDLTLERPGVYFFPLTWTIVHPIDTNSPLFGKTGADLAALQAEFLIMVKGFDESFSQTVHARHSYTSDEVVWNAKFTPAFEVAEAGDLVLELERVDNYKVVES